MGVLNTEILKEIFFAVSDSEKNVERFLLAGKEMLQIRWQYLNRVKEVKIHPNRLDIYFRNEVLLIIFFF